MHAALVRFELRLPEVRSLKSKRGVIKTLTSSLRATFGAAVAEVDHQDLWKRSTLGWHWSRVRRAISTDRCTRCAGSSSASPTSRC